MKRLILFPLILAYVSFAGYSKVWALFVSNLAIQFDDQQFAEEVIKNYKMVEDNYNQFMGGEWGAEFTGSSSVYCHGMMTLQRTWSGSDITKKGTFFITTTSANGFSRSGMMKCFLTGL